MNFTNVIKLSLMVLFFYCTIIICPCYAKSVKNEELDHILSKIEETNKGLVSLKANITVIRSIPLLESEDISKGDILYKKPKQFHIKFLPPRNEINIIDANNVWVYHVDIQQVEKYAISDMGSNSFMNTFIDFGLDSTVSVIRDKYEISLAGYKKNVVKAENDSVNKKYYELTLVPKSDKTGGNYSEIHLWVDDELWMPVIFKLYESGGEIINRIELSNIVLNEYDAIDVFGFKIPENVEVIEPLK